VGSGADHEHGRARQRREVAPELAVDGVHLEHDVRGLAGRHPGRTAERREDARDPPQPAELLPDLLLTGVVEHRDRIRAIDQYHTAHLLGLTGGVAHRDRCAVGPPDEDRTFDIGRLTRPMSSTAALRE
jgi:hypothetical protein